LKSDRIEGVTKREIPATESEMDCRGRDRFRWSLELGARLPEDPPGDDELLDLLGAFEDVQNLSASPGRPDESIKIPSLSCEKTSR
jgi:hypothetical protein